MPKHIILHIGLHKTATTSLQDFLTANLQKLLRQGVRYIPLQRMRTDITPLFCSVDKSRRVKLAEFIDSVGEETLLLSDENMIGVPSGLIQGGVYPYACNRIVSFCEEMSRRRVTIFLTLREPGPFITSMYSEYLRHDEFMPFNRFVESLDLANFSFGNSFKWLFSLPSNTRVRILPFEVANGGGVLPIAREILRVACGADHGIDEGTFPKRHSRSSFSAEEIDLALEVERRAGPFMAKVLLNALDFREKRFGSTRFMPIDEATVLAMRERYEADLKEFARLPG